VSVVVQFNPPMPVDTPKGPGRCFVWENPGMNEHNLWHCWIDATGECWTFQNPEIRMQKNPTFGVRNPPKPSLAEIVRDAYRKDP
jgi:hypothetical protein